MTYDATQKFRECSRQSAQDRIKEESDKTHSESAYQRDAFSIVDEMLVIVIMSSRTKTTTSDRLEKYAILAHGFGWC